MSLLDERELEPAAAPGAETARPVTDPAAFWRAARWPLAVVVVLVVAAVAVAIASGSGTATRLDPASYTPEGSHAIAALLADRGVTVTRVDDVPDGTGTTILVPEASVLNDDTLQRLLRDAHGTDVVVIVDDEGSAESLGLSLSESLTPALSGSDCGFAPADIAGSAATGVVQLGDGTPPGFGQVTSCFGDTLLALQPDSGNGSLTVLTGPDFLLNENLDSNGNAALALELLDHQRPVSWVFPSVAQPPSAGSSRQEGLSQLLPRRLFETVLALLFPLLLVVFWRARRIGPVVTERLPVVVRAVETVRGRARLYRSADARDRAALALREAARARLAARLGLGVTTLPAALVDAVAARTRRPRDEVAGLLYGAAAPPDDPSLVHFADHLDDLVREAGTL